MKVCQLGLLVVALMIEAQLGAAPALANDGVPSQATLSAMGLGDLHVMTDREGLAIRGLGWNGSSAYGQSFAVVVTKNAAAGSKNGYDSSGKYVAGGTNLSFAGATTSSGGGHDNGHGGGNDYGNDSKGGHGGGKPQTSSIKAFSGGSSIGFRK